MVCQQGETKKRKRFGKKKEKGFHSSFSDPPYAQLLKQKLVSDAYTVPPATVILFKMQVMNMPCLFHSSQTGFQSSFLHRVTKHLGRVEGYNLIMCPMHEKRW